MKQYRVLFIGTGMIGIGLAANALIHDFDVSLYDVVPEDKILMNLKQTLKHLTAAGVLTQEAAEQKIKNAKLFTDLTEALKEDPDFVQESVPEREDLKRSIYKTIQDTLGNSPIILSTTSHYFPSVLQQNASYPDRIFVTHPYNPSYLLPLVEICNPIASEETMNQVLDFYTAMGKTPIICKKEVDGYLVNNIAWQVLFTAMDLVEQGVCTVEDVDRAIMFGPGMRMAILGQIMCISLGIDGGIAKGPEKYGLPHKDIYDIAGKGVEEEISHRDPSMGNTVESLNLWRDKALVEILKIQHMI
ncbi:MAG: 3-hydroxyacyl-CoA dehydrogenase family protein [Eubacterium sp.]|jgi:carnitine 3-dehydrogenase